MTSLYLFHDFGVAHMEQVVEEAELLNVQTEQGHSDDDVIVVEVEGVDVVVVGRAFPGLLETPF